MGYYELKRECYQRIDPMILRGEPTVLIVLEASKFGFEEAFVKKRIELLAAAMKEKRRIAKKLAKERQKKEADDDGDE